MCYVIVSGGISVECAVLALVSLGVVLATGVVNLRSCLLWILTAVRLVSALGGVGIAAVMGKSAVLHRQSKITPK